MSDTVSSLELGRTAEILLFMQGKDTSRESAELDAKTVIQRYNCVLKANALHNRDRKGENSRPVTALGILAQIKPSQRQAIAELAESLLTSQARPTHREKRMIHAIIEAATQLEEDVKAGISKNGNGLEATRPANINNLELAETLWQRDAHPPIEIPDGILTDPM